MSADYAFADNVLNAYDDDKTEQLNRGSIQQRTYKDHIDVCDVIATIGKNRPIEAITPQSLKTLHHILAIGKNC